MSQRRAVGFGTEGKHRFLVLTVELIPDQLGRGLWYHPYIQKHTCTHARVHIYIYIHTQLYTHISPTETSSKHRGTDSEEAIPHSGPDERKTARQAGMQADRQTGRPTECTCVCMYIQHTKPKMV